MSQQKGRAPGGRPEALSKSRRRTTQAYQCSACGLHYQTPIPIESAAHRCPARAAVRVLREVTS